MGRGRGPALGLVLCCGYWLLGCVELTVHTGVTCGLGYNMSVTAWVRITDLGFLTPQYQEPGPSQLVTHLMGTVSLILTISLPGWCSTPTVSDRRLRSQGKGLAHLTSAGGGRGVHEALACCWEQW